MTNHSQIDPVTRKITDHEAISLSIRQEQANQSRAIVGGVKSAFARAFRAALRAVSAGSAAYR